MGRNYVFSEPEYGNENVLEFQRINRRTRAGDLVVFRDTDWPQTETLNLNFDFCSEREANDLLELIEASTGSLLQYEDHEGTIWQGFFANTDAAITASRRQGNEVSIAFQTV